MEKIDTSKWGSFKIKDIFIINKGKTLTSIDKKEFKGNIFSDIPCINGSIKNNGILLYLDKSIEKYRNFKLQKSPCLSMSRVGNSGYTLLQDKDFFIADNAYSLKLKNSCSIYVYKFILTILNKEIYKFSYGRIINSKYFESKIKLPITKNNEPDFEYMENYIKSLENKICFRPIYTENKESESNNIDTKNWKLFNLSDKKYFTIYGSETTSLYDLKTKYGIGEYSYITTSSKNNGISGFYDYWTEKGNVLTFDSATVGSIFYQDKNFSASDHVEILEINNIKLNKYIAMFIITMLKKSKYKYGYGRKRNQIRMKNEKILLPVNKNNEPDFEYMENYIKNLPYGDLI